MTLALILGCWTPGWYDGSRIDADQDGYVVGRDCNDHDIRVHPGAPEIWYDGIDQDCDGHDDDQDRDGYGRAEDCDDTDDDRYPGAWETWYDGVDSDCSGDTDFDQDGDTWGWPDDCDDQDPTVYPGAPDDPSDGVDQDCDGSVAADADQDGWASPMDCDDTHPGVHPGADEVWYDGVDQDCDGSDDDQDGDGFDAADDCDDTDPHVRPNAVELCNGVDDDCDGVVDDSVSGPFTFYEDLDADGYGSTRGVEATECAPPTGWAYNDDDCNDGDPQQSPAADEICDNGVDDDCDGAAPACGLDIGDAEWVDGAALNGLVWLDGRRVEAADGQVWTADAVVARGDVDALVDLGDVDGDGWSDVGLSGAGHVLLGPLEDEPVELLGHSTATVRYAGDVDGDGLDDVLAGDGLFYGPVSGDLDAADLSSDGQALVTLDTQGDGVAEILFADDDGVYLEYASWGAVRAGDAHWRRLDAKPMAATADFDGDGYEDLLLATDALLEIHASPLRGEASAMTWSSSTDIEGLWTHDFHDDGRDEAVVQRGAYPYVYFLEDDTFAGTRLASGLRGPSMPRGDSVLYLESTGLFQVDVRPAY